MSGRSLALALLAAVVVAFAVVKMHDREVADSVETPLASQHDHGPRAALSATAMAAVPQAADQSEPAATARGVIHGLAIARDTGLPVADAEVSAVGGREPFEGTSTKSAADGRFELSGLPSGVVEVMAIAQGYRTGASTNVELARDEQADDVRVIMDRAYAISGRVVARNNHAAGITDVTVTAFKVTEVYGAGSATTDATGAFEILGLWPATYRLAAKGDGILDQGVDSVRVGDADARGVIVEAGFGTTLAGRVEPPTRATITLENETAHTQTDASGRFALRAVPLGRQRIIAVTADGHVGTLKLDVASTDRDDLVLTLAARASVSGIVVDDRGAPVAASVVTLDPLDRTYYPGDDHPLVTTGSDGRYEIVGIAATNVRLGASQPRVQSWGGDWEDREKRAVELQLMPGVARRNVTLTIATRSGTLHGRVVGADGRPAANAWVSAQREPKVDGQRLDMATGKPIETAADGTFTIEHVDTGTYTVTAEDDRGHARGSQAGVSLGGSAAITLVPLATVAVRVTSGDQPVTAYELHCDQQKWRTVHVPDGRYELDHVAPGPMECRATSEAGEARGELDVTTGSAELALALTPWATISGTAVDSSGRPVTGAKGWLEDGRSGYREAQSDASGRFVFPQVTSGECIVLLFSPMGEPMRMQVNATAGEQVELGAIRLIGL